MKAQRSLHDRSTSRISTARYTMAALGMLLGVALGGGIGVLLFSLTGQPMYIAIAGVGAGMGLSLGAGLDRQNQTD